MQTGSKKDKAAADGIRQQQHTRNHDRPDSERKGNETFGGTRAGSENVERPSPRSK